ncbi:hypothetical protein L1887_43433 [Cichorium endivia]|nr:hypothetical protein L1887_43433 [Cichorium endivia]
MHASSGVAMSESHSMPHFGYSGSLPHTSFGARRSSVSSATSSSCLSLGQASDHSNAPGSYSPRSFTPNESPMALPGSLTSLSGLALGTPDAPGHHELHGYADHAAFQPNQHNALLALSHGQDEFSLEMPPPSNIRRRAAQSFDVSMLSNHHAEPNFYGHSQKLNESDASEETTPMPAHTGNLCRPDRPQPQRRLPCRSDACDSAVGLQPRLARPRPVHLHAWSLVLAGLHPRSLDPRRCLEPQLALLPTLGHRAPKAHERRQHSQRVVRSARDRYAQQGHSAAAQPRRTSQHAQARTELPGQPCIPGPLPEPTQLPVPALELARHLGWHVVVVGGHGKGCLGAHVEPDAAALALIHLFRGVFLCVVPLGHRRRRWSRAAMSVARPTSCTRPRRRTTSCRLASTLTTARRPCRATEATA